MTSTPRRVRTIDLENPFLESFEGMCEVLLVRHGEQKFFENIPLGQAYDAPLSELGEKQAEAVGKRLASARIGRVYCSDMQRAHDTAKAIAGHHGMEP
ncbi:MAG TPA: histidine phosphatase family protein, partial [Tepidiformaceae bacterium]|nr:histidine phosphatase family protein [Tepidiformaceae bacterium]